MNCSRSFTNYDEPSCENPVISCRKFRSLFKINTSLWNFCETRSLFFWIFYHITKALKTPFLGRDRCPGVQIAVLSRSSHKSKNHGFSSCIISRKALVSWKLAQCHFTWVFIGLSIYSSVFCLYGKGFGAPPGLPTPCILVQCP